MKFGPHGGGHGHYDKLGLVSYAFGGTLAVDPGTQSYTAPTHAMGRGLDYLELEIRQDLIAEAEGQAKFAELIARLLPQALARAAA